MTPRRLAAAIAAMGLIAGSFGCAADRPERPGNQPPDADAELARLQREPAPLPRPVVILNGFRTPAIFARSLEEEIAGATGAQDIALIAYPFSGDIDLAAREVVRTVMELWPGSDPDSTVEVDVVGISMGGLVARWAALAPEARRSAGANLRFDGDPGDYPRLRIARLYTFSTPHRGATLAKFGLSSGSRDMVPGSPFLTALDAADADRGYELVCYAHLRDGMVGATRAAPPGQVPIWNKGTRLFSHYTTHRDPLFVADLIRRLRGEMPLVVAGEPPPNN